MINRIGTRQKDKVGMGSLQCSQPTHSSYKPKFRVSVTQARDREGKKKIKSMITILPSIFWLVFPDRACLNPYLVTLES